MAEQSTVWGFHACQHLIKSRAMDINTLWVSEKGNERQAEIIALAKAHGINAQKANAQQLDSLSQQSVHQGVVIECRAARLRNEHDLQKNAQEDLTTPALWLMLDGVQDPHNLGACLRVADGAGATGCIIPKDRAVSLTPVVRKVACGAAETLPIYQVTNLVRSLDLLKSAGVWSYGLADESAESLYQTDLGGSICLILGAEGQGLRRLTRKHCDSLVSIPMLGAVSSLNVSVATGITLYEAVRQRLTNS